jgi:hypothetical protein
MNSITIIELLTNKYPQIALPAEFLAYIAEQAATGHQIRRARSGQPLVAFLAELGLPHERIAHFLAPDSRIAVQVSFPSLMSMARDELAAFIERHFGLIFELQEIVLDNETLVGFNRHGKEHLSMVTRSILALLPFTELPAAEYLRTEKEALIAGYMHDAGNIIARKYHSLYSIYLLLQLFTDVDHDEATLASFLRIVEAVLFHEVDFGANFSPMSALPPAALSLIVADKTDVSFRRVSTKSNVAAAISDVHILVNLLATHSRIICRKKKVVWQIHFSPKANQEQSTLFPELLKRAQRVWVPTDWQKLYRQDNIEYIFIFNATFLRLYFPRLFLAIRALFALSSTIERFELIVNDDERGVSLKRIFTRDDYQEKINTIGRNLFKHNWQELSVP